MTFNQSSSEIDIQKIVSSGEGFQCGDEFRVSFDE